MLLADIDAWVSPLGLASTAATLFFLVAFWNSIHKAIDRNKQHPANATLDMRVAAVEARASAIEHSMEKLRDEMREDKAEILEAGEHRAAKLHGRINDVLAAVSEVRGRLSST
jgi:hypothetical protein